VLWAVWAAVGVGGLPGLLAGVAWALPEVVLCLLLLGGLGAVMSWMMGAGLCPGGGGWGSGLWRWGLRGARFRAIPDVTCEWPGGAFYASRTFQRIFQAVLADRRWRNVHRISKILLKGTSGSRARRSFGAPGYLRLSYATSIERIDEGCAALNVFLSRLKPHRKP